MYKIWTSYNVILPKFGQDVTKMTLSTYKTSIPNFFSWPLIKEFNKGIYAPSFRVKYVS